MNLVPAYGRDYKSKSAVEADWNADKDFVIADISSPYNGWYVNRPELVGKCASVTIRYKQLREVCVIKVR